MNLLITKYKKEKLKNKLQCKMVRNCFIVIAASMLFIFGDLVPTFIYATILIYCYRDNKKLEEFIDFLDGYEL